jgi:uncharacterized protein YjbI with pentapeptide repeats
LIVFQWFRRLLVVVLAAIASATSAWACSCASNLPGGIPQWSFNAASIVFRGTMHGTEYVLPTHCDMHSHERCRPRLVGVFSIEHALKGSPATLIRIRSPDDALLCGPQLPTIGKTSWVAAVGDEERGYSLSACMFFGPPASGEGDPLADTIAQYQRRLKSLSDAVGQAPSGRSALMALATFYTETNGRLEAIRTLERLLAIEPMHREARLLRARQLANGPNQAAVLEALAPYLAAHPDDHEALHRRVLALVRLDRVSDVPAGWRDFTELRGWSFDFSKAKLNGASFRGNQMYQTSFAKAELRRADFSEAEMWGSSFAGANLAEAVMVKAKLGQGDFRGAVLSGADLTTADLSAADFTGAKLDGVNLSGSRLYRANLSGADLSGATLTGAVYGGTIWPLGFDPAAAGAVKQQ